MEYAMTEMQTAVLTIRQNAFNFAKAINDIDGVKIAPSGVHIEDSLDADGVAGVTFRVPFTINGRYLEGCQVTLDNGRTVFYVYESEEVKDSVDTLAELIERIKSFG
jgi:hypothetical protein